MSIEVRHLSYAYGDHTVLKDVDFSAQPGEYLSILGPNGTGKSTLFRCMLGALRRYGGEVLVDGVDTRSMTAGEMARKVAYIPQYSDPAFNYSVEDIILMGTVSKTGLFSAPRKAQREQTAWAMEKIGIAHLAHRCFHHISGGERQLVLIARALAQQAKILLLDEPTASLDLGNQVLVLSQARALADEGYTVIQTTHDPERSYQFSSRIMALKNGMVVADGRPRDVLTEELIAALYGVEVQVSSLFEDRVRVCTPRFALNTTQN